MYGLLSEHEEALLIEELEWAMDEDNIAERKRTKRDWREGDPADSVKDITTEEKIHAKNGWRGPYKAKPRKLTKVEQDVYRFGRLWIVPTCWDSEIDPDPNGVNVPMVFVAITIMEDQVPMAEDVILREDLASYIGNYYLKHADGEFNWNLGIPNYND